MTLHHPFINNDFIWQVVKIKILYNFPGAVQVFMEEKLQVLIYLYYNWIYDL